MLPVWGAILVQSAQEQQKEKLKAISSALSVLESYGQRFARSIGQSLPEPKRTYFELTHRSLLEIQSNLKKGIIGYSEGTHPITVELLKMYPEKMSRLNLFEKLKQTSCMLLAFPEQVLFYRDLSYTYKKSLLENRTRTVELLNRLFNHHIPLSSIELKPIQIKELSNLYHKGGALFFNNQILYFSDLLYMWSKRSRKNEERWLNGIEKLFIGQISSVECCPVSPWEAFYTSNQESSFQPFLIDCTIADLGQRFGITFTSLVYERLYSIFSNSEIIRSELTYLTANPKGFLNLNLHLISEELRPLARVFQLFQILSPAIDRFQWPVLFHMLLFADIHDFSTIPAKAFSQGYAIQFKKAWLVLYGIFVRGSKQDVSYLKPSKKVEQLFSTPFCFKLLRLIWEKTDSGPLRHLIQGLLEIPELDLTFEDIFVFCEANEHRLELGLSSDCIRIHEEAIGVMKRHKLPITNLKYLFINPPIQDALPTDIPRKVSIFLEHTAKYELPISPNFFGMLRRFLFSENPIRFKLIQNCEAMGVRFDQESLKEILLHDHMHFESEPSPAMDHEALELARKIQNHYSLESKYLYAIYTEAIDLFTMGKQEEIWKTSNLVHELFRICPALSSYCIYYLFKYHPNVPIEHIIALESPRDLWMKSKQLFLTKTQYSQIIEAIELALFYLAPLEKLATKRDERLRLSREHPKEGEFPSSPLRLYEEEKYAVLSRETTQFLKEARESLLSSFFPPLAPLLAHFRIVNITSEGVEWGEKIWKVYEGKINFLSNQSHVGSYFNWFIHEDRYVLQISFCNIKKNTTYSTYIETETRISEIQDKAEDYWGLMWVLSQQLLEESFGIENDLEDNPESWLQEIPGLRETISNFENIIPEWNFFRRAQVARRNLFCAAMDDHTLLPFKETTPVTIASLGNIYPSDPNGSLLPSFALDLETHKEWWLPDAPESLVETFRLKCLEVVNEIVDLGTSLKCKEQTIYYILQIQTPKFYTDTEVALSKNDLVPWARELDGKYVILIADQIKIPLYYPRKSIENKEEFHKLFCFQNLLSKSRAYLKYQQPKSPREY